jgi:hypothetical protein
MVKERSGVLKGNHNLAMQAQRERQARRNAANARAMAHIEAHRARLAQGRTEVAFRALAAEVRTVRRQYLVNRSERQLLPRKLAIGRTL